MCKKWYNYTMKGVEYVGYADIAEMCRDHDMDDELQEWGESGRKSELDNTAEPYDMYSLLAQSAILLTKYDNEPLVKRPFSEALIASLPAQDIAARSFLHILNNSLEPKDGLPDTTFASKVICTVSVCNDAEGLFGAAFEAFEDPHPEIAVQVITDKQEQPLLIRKGGAFQSTLSFVPITINGITYPAGSLFNLNMHQDRLAEGGYSGRPIRFDHPNTKHLVSSIERIRFLRLSAYGLPPERRQAVFEKAVATSAHKSKICWQTPLDSLQDKAARLAQRL